MTTPQTKEQTMEIVDDAIAFTKAAAATARAANARGLRNLFLFLLMVERV